MIITGIRPLVKDPNAKNTESLVRSHLVTVSDSGLLTCAGGKWTTYRQMAEDAVDEAINTFKLSPQTISMPDISGAGDGQFKWTTSTACTTRQIRLAGAHGFSNKLPAQLSEAYGFDADVAHHLATNYGDRAWDVAAAEFGSSGPARPANRLAAAYPFIDGEIRYGIRQEAAQTASDIIARRTRLAFLDVNAALGSLPKVIDVMADELQWSDARKKHEWTESVHFLKSMGLSSDKLSITREEVVKGLHNKVTSEEKHAPSSVRAGSALQELSTGTVLAKKETSNQL